LQSVREAQFSPASALTSFSSAAEGFRLIWLEEPVVARLAAMRGPSESYSDVILRLVEQEAR
jgi:hypothetical protein